MRDATYQLLNEIAVERMRQEEAERYTLEHDDGHTEAQLAQAASSYALAGVAKLNAPVPHQMWRDAARAWPFAEAAKHKHEPRRLFVIAAAFLIAEIERADRAEKAVVARNRVIAACRDCPVERGGPCPCRATDYAAAVRNGALKSHERSAPHQAR